MDDIEGGPVEPGELKEKLNKLAARYVTQPDFAQAFRDPNRRAEIMKGMDFTDEEIKNLGPGFNKVRFETLTRRGLTVDEIISKFTGLSDKPDNSG